MSHISLASLARCLEFSHSPLLPAAVVAHCFAPGSCFCSPGAIFRKHGLKALAVGFFQREYRGQTFRKFSGGIFLLGGQSHMAMCFAILDQMRSNETFEKSTFFQIFFKLATQF